MANWPKVECERWREQCDENCRHKMALIWERSPETLTIRRAAEKGGMGDRVAGQVAA